VRRAFNSGGNTDIFPTDWHSTRESKPKEDAMVCLTSLGCILGRRLDERREWDSLFQWIQRVWCSWILYRNALLWSSVILGDHGDSIPAGEAAGE